MSSNKETIKNKIIYRASYRGTKEMDILMTEFVNYIFKKEDNCNLNKLDEFINKGDEELLEIKKNQKLTNIEDKEMLYIIKKFKKFRL